MAPFKCVVALLAMTASPALAADDADPCHDKYTTEAECNADAATGGGCSWCKAGAVPSSCWTQANAKKLPPGVFECKGASSLLTTAKSARVAGNGTAKLDDYSFESFVRDHGKSYGQEEYLMRKAIFEANLNKVVAHNREHEAGVHTWFMAINHLADWTPEEFKRLRAKRSGEGWGPTPQLTSESRADGKNPDSVDWRTKNVVTPVKNQGGCGSCWAFASTETMESHYAIASGKLLTLAPQAYVNCVQNPHGCGGTGGCAGATEELAFNMSEAIGLPLESDMPYAGRDETCKSYKAAVKNNGFVKLPVNDASAFETALATKGPLAITVAAEPWMMYGGGVFNGCRGASGADLDHGVQAVGYTASYWIVRNSWGPGWGENGYIYISRENDAKTSTDTSPADGVACKPLPKSQTVAGECGILSDSSYPTFDAAVNDEIVV